MNCMVQWKRPQTGQTISFIRKKSFAVYKPSRILCYAITYSTCLIYIYIHPCAVGELLDSKMCHLTLEDCNITRSHVSSEQTTSECIHERMYRNIFEGTFTSTYVITIWRKHTCPQGCLLTLLCLRSSLCQLYSATKISRVSKTILTFHECTHNVCPATDSLDLEIHSWIVCNVTMLVTISTFPKIQTEI